MGNCLIKINQINQNSILKKAREGNVVRIKEILLKGGDVNYQDLESGNNALMIATYSGNYRLVEFLLENGACSKKTNIFGYTALAFAARNGHVEIGRIIISSFKENATVKNIVINAKSKNSDETPLMQAVFWEHRDFVILLLDNGADLYAKSTYGWTALDFAKYKNSNELILIISEKLNREISHRSPS